MAPPLALALLLVKVLLATVKLPELPIAAAEAPVAAVLLVNVQEVSVNVPGLGLLMAHAGSKGA